jgi:hypothetical protein
MPVISATQKTEIRRIWNQPGQTVFEPLSQKTPSQKWTSGMAQGVGPEFKPQNCKKRKIEAYIKPLQRHDMVWKPLRQEPMAEQSQFHKGWEQCELKMYFFMYASIHFKINNWMCFRHSIRNTFWSVYQFQLTDKGCLEHWVKKGSETTRGPSWKEGYDCWW